jgi:hypothetical protein
MHFEDNGSYDPDGGSIVKWEWDVNNDGSYEGEGQSYDYDISISVPGKHYFQCRVTDDEGGTDTLDTPLWLQVDDYEGWTRTWGADDDDEGFAVAVDSDGCSYVTGQFVGTVDFDPGPGVVERTSNGGYDIFLAKYGPAGVLRWVKTWGSSDFDSGYGVAVDNWPNVYVTGSFSGSVDFDTGAGTDYRTSSGYTDVFLSKFSADGEYLWSRQWGGSTGDDGRKVAVVPSTGVSYVCGFFTGTADFDPSPFITENHTSAGYADCFLSKVDSGGTYQWSRTWGGDAPDWPNDVACDAYWDPYVTGFFQGDVDFDPSIGGFDWHTGPGSFLTKFSSTVDFAWARTWGDDFDCEAHGVTVNQTNSDIYVSGEFAGAVDFDPDPLNTFDLSAVMGADAYVSCFNSSGVHQWAWAWGGIGYDVAVDIALDETLNSMIVTGLFEDTCDFDPGTGADWRACQGGYDIFMNRISLSGGYEYARTWGSTSADEGYGVAVNQATGNIFLTGNFMGSMDFDPGPGVDVHVPDSGSRDVFLIKLRPNGLY